MNKDRIQNKMNKYGGKVIKKNFGEHIYDKSKSAYDENVAVEKGYEVLEIHKDVSKNSIKSALHQHNTEKIFDKVKTKFFEIYEFEAPKVDFVNNRTMGNLYAFYKDDLIFADRMLEDSLHEFFMITFIWAKYFENEDLYGKFFNYLTTVLYAVSVDKGNYNIYELEYVKKEINEWSNVVNLAVSCQYFCMYFYIAHEYAHKYIDAQNMKFNEKKEEFKADSIAYDIVLKLMEDELKNEDIKNRELFDYCYLAPIMMLDYLELLFYTNRVIKNAYVETDSHPQIKQRKENLFSIPYDNKYIFNTNEGNDVYSSFLDVIDKYKTELLYRKHNGTLDDFIEYLLRGV